MTALNFKTIVIGLASLLMVSVAQAKCYPGLDCPEDLPNANNNTPRQSTTPSTEQKTQVPESLPTPELIADEPQPIERIVGRKAPQESTDAPEEESPTLTKYGKYSSSTSRKYSKYPK